MNPFSSKSRMVPILAIAVVLAGVWWLYQNEPRSPTSEEGAAGSAISETEAADLLRELGAFVMLDANRQHVQSVDLRLPGVDEHLQEILRHVAQLPHLEILHLGGTSVADEDLSRLAVHRKLTTLGLNDTAISDAGLAHLWGLKNLIALYMSGTKISSVGLQQIHRLSKLQILDLSGTRIGGDLGGVTRLPQLQHLLLRDIALEDQALESLGDLPRLGRLTLIEANVSDAALGKLRAAMPELSIDR